MINITEEEKAAEDFVVEEIGVIDFAARKLVGGVVGAVHTCGDGLVKLDKFATSTVYKGVNLTNTVVVGTTVHVAKKAEDVAHCVVDRASTRLKKFDENHVLEEKTSAVINKGKDWTVYSLHKGLGWAAFSINKGIDVVNATVVRPTVFLTKKFEDGTHQLSETTRGVLSHFDDHVTQTNNVLID